MTSDPGYSHTQKSPICLLVYGTGLAMLIGAWATRDEMPIALILGITGVLTFLLGMAFHHLTVVDQGEVLAIRFECNRVARKWFLGFSMSFERFLAINGGGRS